MAAYCCRVLNYGVLGFLDDTKAVGAEINGVPVLGGFEVAEGEAFGDDVSFYVAVGDPAGRIAVYERLVACGRRLQTIIHPRSEIFTPSEVGEGSYIGVFVLVGINARIDDYVIVPANASVGPDARLERGSWMAARSSIGRGAVVGTGSLIGIRATVLPDIRIGENCAIGAGSLATKNIPDNSVAYGSPCRVVRRND